MDFSYKNQCITNLPSLENYPHRCLLHYIHMLSLPHRPWADPITEIEVGLGTSVQYGLSEKTAEERLQKVGENVFELTKVRRGLRIFLNQFVSPLIIILCVAVAVTAFLGEWLD